MCKKLAEIRAHRSFIIGEQTDVTDDTVQNKRATLVEYQLRAQKLQAEYAALQEELDRIVHGVGATGAQAGGGAGPSAQRAPHARSGGAAGPSARPADADGHEDDGDDDDDFAGLGRALARQAPLVAAQVAVEAEVEEEEEGEEKEWERGADESEASEVDDESGVSEEDDPE